MERSGSGDLNGPLEETPTAIESEAVDLANTLGPSVPATSPANGLKGIESSSPHQQMPRGRFRWFKGFRWPKRFRWFKRFRWLPNGAVAAAVTKEKHATSQLAARLHNSTLPIFRIPDGILSYILELITPCESSESSMITWDPKDRKNNYFPLFQSFISMNLTSQGIREVAIHTPRCWTKVIISFTENHFTSPAALDAQLKRSESLLFDLIIFVNNGYARTKLSKLSSTLRPHIYRCRRIEVCAGKKCLEISTVAKTIQNFQFDCPALRSARLADYTPFRPIFNQYIELVPFWNQQDSQLQPIDIEFGGGAAVHPQPSIDDFKLSWRVIRRLRISRGLGKGLVLSIASQCPNLECFDWRFHGCDDDETPFHSELPEQLELPNLKKLRLGVKAPAGSFPQLTAPKCEVLSLSDLGGNMHNDWLLGQTLPALRKITFDRMGGHPGKVHDFLSRHPNLEEIRIRVRNFGNIPRVRNECQLLSGLADSAITGKVPPPERSAALLPALRMLWYSVEVNHSGPRQESESFGDLAVLAQVFRQLLKSRPDLSIIFLPRNTGGHLAESIVELRSKSEGQFVVKSDEAELRHSAPLEEPW
ncbi:hypothetical protein DL93DRAFT_2160633 [Clavulina sp. PMI_390]|nr:hypothetical protein DL93DRAFT_2160633 [Clavulina sp. PMI_390]